MAEFTGAALYVSFGGVVLSGDAREFKDSSEYGLVDASAGADTNIKYLKTQGDGTASLTALLQSGAANAIYAAVAPGTEGTLQWGPEGAGAGAQKFSINAIAKKRELNVKYNDVVEFSVDFQYSSATPVSSGTF